MNRKYKRIIKKGFHELFKKGQKLGIDILPRHFYSQVPDFGELNRERYWREPSSMIGVQGIDDIETQKAFVQDTCRKEYTEALHEIQSTAIGQNGEDAGYGEVESDFLFCFVCRYRPAKIIQIGCGVSTAIILMAAEHAGYTPQIVCVEPYPTDYLVKIAGQGLIELVVEKAQKVRLETLTSLESGDMLFVDSTHTVKPGSEVNRVIFEVLPRLKKEVWVHFHDIFYPYDYQRRLLIESLFVWSESSLLHAFLIGNTKFTVALSQSMLHYEAPEVLKDAIAVYDPQDNDDGLQGETGTHFPASIYLITTK
jgi:Methyltransferase domain